MTKSGLADSPFFSRPSLEATPAESSVLEKPQPVQARTMQDAVANRSKGGLKPSTQDTMVPSNPDTVVSRIHDTMVEIVRKAVKEIGKEAATHRFTPEEKRAVLDIIYSYKSSGIKTSENEVARIAINYVLEDYKQNGQNSILDQVLKALNE
jgi:hypothetical protein